MASGKFTFIVVALVTGASLQALAQGGGGAGGGGAGAGGASSSAGTGTAGMSSAGLPQRSARGTRLPGTAERCRNYPA
jgi:hypothetical protein